MQVRAEAAGKELAAVKERAWALMEEKDLQLQAAKVTLRCSAGPLTGFLANPVEGS